MSKLGHMSIQPELRIPPLTLATRLRMAREWRHLEQGDIAKELGIGRSTVSNYEREATVPGKLVLNAWAVVCDVDVEWLKTGDLASGGDGGGSSSRSGGGHIVNLRNTD